MKTHAICASTASTAGFSVRVIARSTLPFAGTTSRVAVSAMSAVTSGATATPAAAMRNATRRRYRSRKVMPTPTLRHHRTSAASTAFALRGVGASTENALVMELHARVERRGPHSSVFGVREEHRRGGDLRSAVPTACPEPEAAHRGSQVADTASEAFERDGRAAAAACEEIRVGARGREAPLTAARTAAMVCVRCRAIPEIPKDELVSRVGAKTFDKVKKEKNRRGKGLTREATTVFFPLLEVHEPFSPRHRKGADGPHATHSHAHVLRNNCPHTQVIQNV